MEVLEGIPGEGGARKRANAAALSDTDGISNNNLS